MDDSEAGQDDMVRELGRRRAERYIKLKKTLKAYCISCHIVLPLILLTGAVLVVLYVGNLKHHSDMNTDMDHETGR